MLTLLILFSTLKFSLSIPIAASSTKNISEPIIVSGCQRPECMNIASYRTGQEILLSCLATIFACTWVVIHPNLPGPLDSGRIKLRRKVMTAIYAVLAPEYLAMWALRQRIAAGRIALEFNVKHRGADDPLPVSWYTAVRRAPKMYCTALSVTVIGWWRGPGQNISDNWTLTHGFFVQMGGFMLCAGEKPIRVLPFADLMKMINEGLVEVPRVTERYINDKRKGDFLTKLLVVLQTTWFSFQCFARWATDLPVTELEVATLAFAVLNVVTYGLWWKKPQSIEVAVSIQLKSGVMDMDRSVRGEETTKVRLLEGGYEKENAATKDLMTAVSKGWVHRLLGVSDALFWDLRRPIIKMIGDDDSAVRRTALRMPIFYADRREDQDLVPIMAIAVLFGSLHLIPWSSAFSPTAELWLWRFSALFITMHPLLLILCIVAESRSRFIQSAIDVTYIATLPLYYLARLTLLVLAFATLRALPKEVYATIEWTTFIPHL